jgi:hypothetical protein
MIFSNLFHQEPVVKYLSWTGKKENVGWNVCGPPTWILNVDVVVNVDVEISRLTDVGIYVIAIWICVEIAIFLIWNVSVNVSVNVNAETVIFSTENDLICVVLLPELHQLVAVPRSLYASPLRFHGCLW